MSTTSNAITLIIGASGTVGSHLVRELDRDHGDLKIRLSTSRKETAEQWKSEGRDSIVLDLNRPQDFDQALIGVRQLFLLTGYSADMLYQSKCLVDAAVDAGVSHIVHHGVFSSRRDFVPHFVWYDMIETYIQASGIAWTHLHPSVITDTVLRPELLESGSFSVMWGNAQQAWVSAVDIAAVAAVVFREAHPSMLERTIGFQRNWRAGLRSPPFSLKLYKLQSIARCNPLTSWLLTLQ